MAVSYTASTEQELLQARNEVLSELRSRVGLFLAVPDSELGEKHREIAEAFLKWLHSTGFALEIVALDDANAPGMFEGRWTHNGAAFVGFKQAPAAKNRADAALLACAALLRNDWCRARLPHQGN
jgi:hypothetical protein